MAAPVKGARRLVVRFAGDSGDGVQLAGLRFATEAAGHGADLMTLPEYPAEIRAPAGTTFGVSAYQVQFGAGEVLTPGDEADLLVAFNPAAFATNLSFLKPGGTLVVDESAFRAKAVARVGLPEAPLDAAEERYRVLRVDISRRTLEAVAEHGLGRKESLRARNFWALGLALWLCGEETEATLGWIDRQFARVPESLGVNRSALVAGHAYGETMELAEARPKGTEAALPAEVSRNSRMISGTEAMALGIAAVGALSGRAVHYCSYPITPASALLHAVARQKQGLTTFQAEDEIAAICAAIGAAYAGSIGVTASSGPGLALKTEAMGLAIAVELPLLVIDVQRAGPSTGMPTKPEQSDLTMAIYGRHGEAPLPVFAPATPGDCFSIMIDAARAALKAMTPVIVLSDAFLANAVSEWTPPDIDSLPGIDTALLADGAQKRDPETLARPWVTPGVVGGAFRVGGLEKDAESGNISYDPDNHAAMVAMRAEKIARLARPGDRALLQEGPELGDLLAISWGSSFGSVRQATRNLRAAGHSVAHLHLRRLWPLPPELAEILPRYRRLVSAELNLGQLAGILRSTYLLPVEVCSQVNGRPFPVSTLEAAFAERLGEAAA